MPVVRYDSVNAVARFFAIGIVETLALTRSSGHVRT